MFFAQTAFMLLGGSALVDPDAASLLYVALLCAYELVFVARLGQTPGKDLLDVKVVGPDGGAPGAARTVRRLVVLLPLLVVPQWPLVVTLVAATVAVGLVHPERRAAHDLVAGTRVVRYDADEVEALPPVDLDPLDRMRRERRFR